VLKKYDFIDGLKRWYNRKEKNFQKSTFCVTIQNRQWKKRKYYLYKD